MVVFKLPLSSGYWWGVARIYNGQVKPCPYSLSHKNKIYMACQARPIQVDVAKPIFYLLHTSYLLLTLLLSLLSPLSLPQLSSLGSHHSAPIIISPLRILRDLTFAAFARNKMFHAKLAKKRKARKATAYYLRPTSYSSLKSLKSHPPSSHHPAPTIITQRIKKPCHWC